MSITVLKRLAGDVMFAVITPDGRLVVRAALGRASDTQWGPTRSNCGPLCELALIDHAYRLATGAQR